MNRYTIFRHLTAFCVLLSILSACSNDSDDKQAYTLDTVMPDPETRRALYDPRDIAISDSGLVYVACRRRIVAFDRDGATVLEFGSIGDNPGQFDYNGGIFSLTLDHLGNVYVAARSRIQKFDASGNFITFWGGYGTALGEFMSIGDMRVDSAGNVWVVDSGNTRIQKFSSDGEFLMSFGGEGTAPVSSSSPTTLQ